LRYLQTTIQLVKTIYLAVSFYAPTSFLTMTLESGQ
jgi:hypothetical protein